MDAQAVQLVLAGLEIASYPDGCNPTTQVHFDYKDRAFYLEKCFSSEFWMLYEIGHTTFHGETKFPAGIHLLIAML